MGSVERIIGQALSARTKQANPFGPLTCTMEPEVGFEPTTFRLRVEEQPSTRYYRGRFKLLTSAGSSIEGIPDLWRYGGRNDREDDQPRHGRTANRVY